MPAKTRGVSDGFGIENGSFERLCLYVSFINLLTVVSASNYS